MKLQNHPNNKNSQMILMTDCCNIVNSPVNEKKRNEFNEKKQSTSSRIEGEEMSINLK